MNLLQELVETARETIRQGYYRPRGEIRPAPSLVKALRPAQPGRMPIIAELKPATPRLGKLVEGNLDALTTRFAEDGAAALSVLTEPRHFHGSLAHLRTAVRTRLPVLMKDFILAEEQIDCAAHHGASAILLIASILPKKRLADLTEYAHLTDREVLVEVANEKEYAAAMEGPADLVGINNRDLRTFDIDVERTVRIAATSEKLKPLISMSGFTQRQDVARVAGVADAVLVGTSLLDGTTTIPELAGP